MPKSQTHSDDESDTMERIGTESSDEELPVIEPQKMKRVYKRKGVEEDGRRKGNHARSPAQIAAFARMLEVRKKMNEDRKVAKGKKMIERSKAIEDTVAKRRTKQEANEVAEDELVSARLAGKTKKVKARKPPPPSESESSSSEEDIPSPPPTRKSRKPSARKTVPVVPDVQTARFVFV